MDSLQGHLLIASPHLPDPNFYRSVVLMIDHSDESTTGLVLNRPGPHTVGEVWKEVGETPCDSGQAIGIGGPLKGPLMAVHTLSFCAEDTVFPGMYVSSQRDYLERIVAQEDNRFRIFTGYAGWGPGQLEAELEHGGWMTCPACTEHILRVNPDNLWDWVAQKIGKEITVKGLKIKHVPDDPSLN